MAIDFNITLGAVQSGSFLSFLWTGVILAQAYAYFVHYKDPWGLRAVVAFVVFCCCFDTALQGSWSYDMLVRGFGNEEGLARFPWQFPTGVLMIVVVNVNVEMFYSWRLYQLGDRILPFVIILFACTHCSSMLYVLGHLMYRDHLVADLNSAFPVAWVWLSFTLAADMTVTTGMLYRLAKTGEEKFSSKTTMFLTYFVRAAQSNVVSLFFQCMAFITFKAVPGFWFAFIDALLCKALGFSLMCNLLSRPYNSVGFGGGLTTSAFTKRESQKPFARPSVASEKVNDEKSEDKTDGEVEKQEV